MNKRKDITPKWKGTNETDRPMPGTAQMMDHDDHDVDDEDDDDVGIPGIPAICENLTQSYSYQLSSNINIKSDMN